jgi:hypothetical protein
MLIDRGHLKASLAMTKSKSKNLSFGRPKRRVLVRSYFYEKYLNITFTYNESVRPNECVSEEI